MEDAGQCLLYVSGLLSGSKIMLIYLAVKAFLV